MSMKTRTFIRLTFFIIFIALIVWGFVYYHASIHPKIIKSFISSYGLWAPLAFILLYILATIVFLPGVILTISGGLIFGPILGTLYNIIGATLGATIAFMIARYFARDWVKRKTGEKLKPLMQGIEEEGWKFVAFVRLVPVIPFNLLNYALGITEVRLIHYIIASFIFMLPGAFAYTYLGHAGAAIAARQEGYIRTILFAIGFFALLIFIPYFIKKLRQKYRSRQS